MKKLLGALIPYETFRKFQANRNDFYNTNGKEGDFGKASDTLRLLISAFVEHPSETISFINTLRGRDEPRKTI